MADTFKVRLRTYVWRTRVRQCTSQNGSNNDARKPGETRLVCVRPAGKVRRLTRPRNQYFVFILVHCLPLLGWAIFVSLIPCLLLPPFRCLAVSSPPCCLIPLPIRPTRLCCWYWRVSAAILRLSEKSRRLQHWYLPSGTRLNWRIEWERDCC